MKNVIKKFLACAICIIIISQVIPISANASKVLHINSEEDLYKLKNILPGSTAILDRDIMCNDFKPLDTISCNFEGNNHTITIDNFSEKVFGGYQIIALTNLNSGYITNLNLVVSVLGNFENKSCVVGGGICAVNTGSIKNCKVEALYDFSYDAINANIGAIAGENDDGIIENCIVTVKGSIEHNEKINIDSIAKISTEMHYGGIVGCLNGTASLSGCYTKNGNLKINLCETTYGENLATSSEAATVAYIGGIVGESTCDIKNCGNLTEISVFCAAECDIKNYDWLPFMVKPIVNMFFGGVVGKTKKSVCNSYNAVPLKSVCCSTHTEIKGIVDISNCNSEININVGGVIGKGQNNNKISCCYNTGKIDITLSETFCNGYQNSKIGGIAGGLSYCTLSDCFNWGDIVYNYDSNKRTDFIGGICADSDTSKIITSYNAADFIIKRVRDEDMVKINCGGIYAGKYEITEGCYYAIPTYKSPLASNAFPVTKSELKKKDLYTTYVKNNSKIFDFDNIWEFNPSHEYPILKNMETISFISDINKYDVFFGYPNFLENDVFYNSKCKIISEITKKNLQKQYDESSIISSFEHTLEIGTFVNLLRPSSYNADRIDDMFMYWADNTFLSDSNYKYFIDDASRCLIEEFSQTLDNIKVGETDYENLMITIEKTNSLKEYINLLKKVIEKGNDDIKQELPDEEVAKNYGNALKLSIISAMAYEKYSENLIKYLNVIINDYKAYNNSRVYDEQSQKILFGLIRLKEKLNSNLLKNISDYMLENFVEEIVKSSISEVIEDKLDLGSSSVYIEIFRIAVQKIREYKGIPSVEDVCIMNWFTLAICDFEGTYRYKIDAINKEPTTSRDYENFKTYYDLYASFWSAAIDYCIEKGFSDSNTLKEYYNQSYLSLNFNDYINAISHDLSFSPQKETYKKFTNKSKFYDIATGEKVLITDNPEEEFTKCYDYFIYLFEGKLLYNIQENMSDISYSKPIKNCMCKEYKYVPEKKSTCTSRGHSSYSFCVECGAVCTKMDIYGYSSHMYSGEYTIDKKPTYVTTGKMSRHCLNCKAKCDNIVIPVVPRGDINDDQSINSIDLIVLKKGLLKSTDNSILYDVNLDSEFDIRDLIAIKKILSS